VHTSKHGIVSTPFCDFVLYTLPSAHYILYYVEHTKYFILIVHFRQSTNYK